jgi:FAD/FMN-containing dehydrogenase
VRQPSDVQAACAFAALTGVNVVVKNIGHGFKGRSSGKDSLALWVHNLKGKTYNAKFTPAGCPANKKYTAMTLGTGEGWQDVYDWAESIGVTAVGGYHQTVSAAGGWVLGGGHSILTPVYGLGVDRVVQFKIVTPDGQVRIANECQNSDLFFALRGGGGSAWGVVLEVTSVVEPKHVPLIVYVLLLIFHLHDESLIYAACVARRSSSLRTAPSPP